MIPVVILPVINSFETMEANLALFDEPVGRLVIIDNSCTGYTYRPPADSPFERVEHIRPIIGLGPGGGGNAAISQTPDAPWWLGTSTDISFGPGDLAAIVALMEAATGPAVVSGSQHDRRLRAAYLALNRACVDAIGLIDEWAFFPAYFEDDDYQWRCAQGGVEWIAYDGTIGHDTSISIRSDERLARRNADTFPENGRRYKEKWGGMPGSEQFRTPYNLPVPLSYVRVDLAGRAARLW